MSKAGKADAPAGRSRSFGSQYSLNSVSEHVLDSDAAESGLSSLKEVAGRTLWTQHRRRGSYSPRTGRSRTPEWRKPGQRLPVDVTEYLDTLRPSAFVCTAQPRPAKRGGGSVEGARTVVRMHRVVRSENSQILRRSVRLTSVSDVGHNESVRGVSSLGAAMAVSGGFGHRLRLFDLASGLGIDEHVVKSRVSSVCGVSDARCVVGHSHRISVFDVVDEDRPRARPRASSSVAADPAAGVHEDSGGDRVGTSSGSATPRPRSTSQTSGYVPEIRDERAPCKRLVDAAAANATGTITDLTPMPTGRVLAALSSGHVQVMNYARLLTSAADGPSPCSPVDCSINATQGTWLWAASCSGDGAQAISGCSTIGHVAMIDLATETILRTMQGHDNVVRCATWSPSDASIAYTGSYASSVAIWDVRMPAPAAVMHTMTGKLSMKLAVVSNDILVSAREFGGLSLFSLRQRKAVQSCSDVGAPLCAVRRWYPS